MGTEYLTKFWLIFPFFWQIEVDDGMRFRSKNQKIMKISLDRDEKSVCVSSIEVITHLMTVFEGMSVQ